MLTFTNRGNFQTIHIHIRTLTAKGLKIKTLEFIDETVRSSREPTTCW